MCSNRWNLSIWEYYTFILDCIHLTNMCWALTECQTLVASVNCVLCNWILEHPMSSSLLNTHRTWQIASVTWGETQDAKWPLRLSMCLAMDGSLRFGTEAAEVVRTEILLLYKLLSQRSCSVWLWRTQVRTKYQRFAKLKNNCTLCPKFWQHGSLLTSKENQRTSNWKEITLSFLIYPLIPELGCVSGQNSSKILKGNEVAE